MMPAARFRDHVMKEIVQAFLDIAMLRRGPEDLPASGFLLALTGVAYLASGALTVATYARSAGDFVAQLALDLVLMLVFFAALLAINRKAARIEQTLTAVLGTGAIVAILSLPLTLWLGTQGAASPTAIFPAVGIYVLVLWSIGINGHILRRALEIPYTGGVVLAAGYFILNVAIFARVFPAIA
jgi:hypothetical protein